MSKKEERIRRPPELVVQNTVALAASFVHSNMMTLWGLPQVKLFFCFLESINWSDEGEDADEYVYIDKADIVQKMGLNFKDDHHNSFDTYLRKELKKLITNSCIELGLSQILCKHQIAVQNRAKIL